MDVLFCKVPGAIKVGGGALQDLLPRSDTVSAALTCLWPQLHRTVNMESFAKEPPFRISSALPWVTDRQDQRVLLLPTPIRLIQESCRGNKDSLKTYRKALYVDRPLITEMLSQRQLRDPQIWDQGQLLTSFTGKHGNQFARQLCRTRLAVDRLSCGPLEGMLFDQTQWVLNQGSGIAFVVDVPKEQKEPFMSVFRLLCMEGIGAERSVGLGQLEPVETQPFKNNLQGRDSRLLLSLCHPTEQDVKNGILEGAYSLIERTGWVTVPYASNLRRSAVRMLTEGSWFPERVEPNAGDVCEVLPANPELGLHHPVYRDGRALTINIGLQRVP